MASGNDMKAHQGTYGSFIALLKWTVPLLAIIGLLVIVLISSCPRTPCGSPFSRRPRRARPASR